MNLLARVHLSELAVVAALMFFGVAGAIPGIAPNQANEMTGAAASGLQTAVGIGSQVLVDGMLALLLALNYRRLATSAANLRWPFLLAVWIVLSTLWSQDPLLTGRRAVPFALATGFGVLLAVRFSQRRFLFLLQASLAALACWSAVLALGFPSIGLDASTGHGGDWQGVFTQKNACGRSMVFAIAAVLASGRVSAGRGLLLLLFTAELALSGSRGAWVLAAVLASALLVFRMSCRFDRRTRTALFAGAALLSVVLAGVVAEEFATLALLLGRDATLTGRTAIWHEVWLSILHRPLLGYGFAAFWRGAQGASWSVLVALRFVLFHAHNGFLEIWLELGAAGLLLFALGFARAAFLLWPELRAGRFAEAAWPASTLLLVALYDIDENTLLSFNGLFWVLYTAALTQIELLAADRRACGRVVARAAPDRPKSLPLLAPHLIPPLPARTALIEEGSRSPWL